MLHPNTLDHYPDRLVELYAQVEADILADMAKRISAYDDFIPAAEFQFRKLQDMGNLYDEILRRLSAITGKSTSELKQLIQDAGATALEADDAIYRKAGLDPRPIAQSPALQAILETGLQRTQGLFDNLTRTTANTATKQFERALDRAWLQTSTGAFSHTEATRMAIKDLAARGVAVIEYPSGHVDSMDVAVRRAVLTGANQTALRMQDARADELGSDLVEVTAHAGARIGDGGQNPGNHSWWQGKIYSRSGTHPKYPPFIESTGYGTGEGLGGWNCRHSYYPFFEGVSEPAYTQEELDRLNAPMYEYNGKKLTEQEAVDRQRYIERQLRRWKREYKAMEAAGQPTEEAAAKIAKWQDTQKDFLKQTGLKRQYDRESVGGFGRSEATKVVWASKKALDNLPDTGIIKSSDIEIGRSLGAAAFRDTVKLPGGELSKITEGSTITKVVVFAGKGTKKIIRDAPRLEIKYGAPQAEWQKVRGDGYVDVSGKSEHAELHWYQAQSVGRVEMKVKRWFE